VGPNALSGMNTIVKRSSAMPLSLTLSLSHWSS
jgi:hypothetical protein